MAEMSKTAKAATKKAIVNLNVPQCCGKPMQAAKMMTGHRRLHYAYPAFRLKFEALSVGQVLVFHSVRDACTQGLTLYDFGHGEAEYKRFWANERQQIERVFVGRGVLGRAMARGLAAAWTLVRRPVLRQIRQRPVADACRTRHLSPLGR